MPVHDWSRVIAGTFHDFHNGWIAELTRAFNNGVLPDRLYALSEQQAGEFAPDVLALEQLADEDDDPEAFTATGNGHPATPTSNGRAADVGLALLEAPPRLSIERAVEPDAFYALRRRTIAIRHATNDRIVALIEIASPANKDRASAVEQFVHKAVAATQAGYHLVVIDLFPPRASDGGENGAGGLCNAAFREMGGEPFALPPGKPLCVAAFRVAGTVHCYAEPLAVGDALPDVPLFFSPDRYVNAPLEPTYAAAYAGVPKRWRAVIEATA